MLKNKVSFVVYCPLYHGFRIGHNVKLHKMTFCCRCYASIQYMVCFFFGTQVSTAVSLSLPVDVRWTI